MKMIIKKTITIKKIPQTYASAEVSVGFEQEFEYETDEDLDAQVKKVTNYTRKQALLEMKSIYKTHFNKEYEESNGETK